MIQTKNTRPDEHCSDGELFRTIRVVLPLGEIEGLSHEQLGSCLLSYYFCKHFNLTISNI